MRCEYHVGVVEHGMALRRLGIEDIESHASEPPGLQRSGGRIEVNQAAATAVDQNRSRPNMIEKCIVDQVMCFFGQGYVQRHDIARRGKF